ncbi:MAG: protein kinase [Phycisphaerae bacterium]|nr:protein kinase [Phycisphaerae bacterium]NUQ45709.1 protein kinase [Phycisphaerae bacterium]
MSDESKTANEEALDRQAHASAQRRLVRELFEAALDLPPEQRLDFVRSKCADADVVCEVESLLGHEQRAGDEFLMPPSAAAWTNLPGEPRAIDAFIGARVGAYTIKALIAEGGMGAVYLAEQDRPRRDVALKIMTDGFWSRSARRRFEFETEILGRLHHPNIAQVYEAGVADVFPLPKGQGRGEGRPPLEREVTLERESLLVPPPAPVARVHYFAMEYIPNARPITAYCDEKSLGLSDRLHLFREVCDAVHYGHQNGVIHRDLKPDNILIDAHGHVKVIDFGVARATDCDVAATMNTEAGQLIGTLAYMSPEQCAADSQAIDTRSDVYSLGAVLFELLTGGLPYDVSHLSVPSATRVICEQPPARPSDVAARITANRRAVAPPPPPVMNVAQQPPPVNVAQPPSAVMDVAQPPSAVMNVAQPPSAVMDVAQPPSAVMNVAQPPPAVFPRSTGFQPVKSPSPIRQDHSADAEALAARTDSRRFGILATRLRGDLDTIILKCLEKDRNKRYHSVAALADDVERYLRREPISARPPTRWTKTMRWVSQHPVAMTAAACLVTAASTVALTGLGVWYIGLRPDQIVCYRDGMPITKNSEPGRADEARLVTIADKLLHRWGGEAGSIAFAEFMARPARFGGGDVAAIGYTESSSGPYGKSLCVFDVLAERNRPIWQGKIQQWEVLKKLVQKRSIDAHDFAPCVGIAADVFPGDDYPGDELVVKFGTRFSQRIIRIYDLRGALLFETWHDGSAGWCESLCDAGTLVFAGDDHQRGWDDEGNATTPAAAPLVVFAIRPTPDSINRLDFLNSNENLALLASGRGPPWLAWYKWVYAGNDGPVRGGECSITLQKPIRGDMWRIVQLDIRLNYASGIACISWEIDEYGNELPGTRTADETYKRALAAGERLPDPNSFHLRDVPPDGDLRPAASSQPAGAAPSTPPDSTVTLPTEPQREGELPVEP